MQVSFSISICSSLFISLVDMLLMDVHLTLDDDGTLAKSRFFQFVEVVVGFLSSDKIAHSASPIRRLEGGVNLQFRKKGAYLVASTLSIGLVGTGAASPIDLDAVTTCLGLFASQHRADTGFFPLFLLFRDELLLSVHHVVKNRVLMYYHCAIPLILCLQVFCELLRRHGDGTQKDGECKNKKAFHLNFWIERVDTIES